MTPLGQPHWWPLRKALVRPPLEGLTTPEAVARWGYRTRLAVPRAQQDHAAFVAVLRTAGVHVMVHDAPAPGLVDSVFATDAALPTRDGVVLLRFGKALRAPEVDHLKPALRSFDIPVLGQIESPGTVEGGDCLWLDAETLLVAEGYRTNANGIEQLRALLPGVTIIEMPLPHADGPGACLHLQSLLSTVREDLVLAWPRLMPVRLVTLLARRGITRVDVAPEEYGSLGTNALCLRAGEVVLPDGNPKTASALRAHGVKVHEVPGDALMRNGSGGPTCLTLAIQRLAPTL